MLPDEVPLPGPRPEFSDRPIHLMAVLGLGSLVGFVGVTGGYSVHDRVELGGGVGYNGEGVMGGPYVRLRPLVSANQYSHTLHAFAVDVGLSMGRLDYDGGPITRMTFMPEERTRYRSDFVAWLQTELGWEMLKVEGFSMRAGYSGSLLLNEGNVDCEPAALPDEGQVCGHPPKFLLGVFFSMGYAL